MRKLVWMAPALLWLAGCSNDSTPSTYAAPATAAPADAPAAHAGSAEVVAAASPFVPDNGAPSPDPKPPARVPTVLASGTPLHVRVDDAIDTRRNRAGDRFQATLVRPVVVDGRTVLPAGTRFRGHITTAAASGRLKGRAVLGLTLDSFHLRGRDYGVETTHVSRFSEAHKRRNAILMGGGAALGTTIGALAGGGKGAAVGAFAGGGAGT